MFRDIVNQDIPDVEKLKQAFDQITATFLQNEAQQLELHKTMCDEDETIKAYIKIGVMQTARGMFQQCYFEVTRANAHTRDKR